MTAEDALNKYDPSLNDNQVRIGRAQIIVAMKEYAGYMYNQAIDDAVENAQLHQKYYNKYDHKTMYLRWKDKGYPRVDGDGDQYGVDVITIDKDSILKLKK